MKTVLKPLVLSALIAGASLTALAQTPPPAANPPTASQPSRQERMERMHARMQERMAQRQAALKSKLQITAAQESAWTTFTNALRPPAARPQRPDRSEFERLTTPERIDRLRALKAQRDAEMVRRGDATKAFYATLSPEQQKVFDSETLRFGRHRHGGPGHGGHRMRG